MSVIDTGIQTTTKVLLIIERSDIWSSTARNSFDRMRGTSSETIPSISRVSSEDIRSLSDAVVLLAKKKQINLFPK